MTIKDLVALAKARIAYLERLRQTAAQQGDVEQIARLDAELEQTQATLTGLLSLG